MGLFDFLFGTPKFNTVSDQKRIRQARKIYNPFQDKPLSLEAGQGSLVLTAKKKGGLAYNASLSSPLIDKNVKTQNSLANQAGRLAQDTNKLYTNPNSSRMYKAFKGQLDTSFDQLRGETRSRMADSQNSALGRITGNNALYQVATQKAAQPYTFATNYLNPAIQQNIANQQGLQQVNSGVTADILNSYNVANSAQQASTNRRQAESTNRFSFAQDYRNNRINRSVAKKKQRLETIGSVAGGIGGFFLGGPAGAAAGAKLGGSLAGGFAPVGVGGYAPAATTNPQAVGNSLQDFLQAYQTKQASKVMKQPSYGGIFDSSMSLPSASAYSGLNAGVS